MILRHLTYWLIRRCLAHNFEVAVHVGELVYLLEFHPSGFKVTAKTYNTEKTRQLTRR